MEVLFVLAMTFAVMSMAAIFCGVFALSLKVGDWVLDKTNSETLGFTAYFVTVLGAAALIVSTLVILLN